ncbi:hypothetical protein O7A70_32680 [Mesorhizobium sp. Cs1299R1N1]|uniref:hypothetical protein n=1 Tax=Mesorhizobium sp. Cs1299R1N1 TaxID=3015172 RepID=UPI00301B8A0C
MLRADPQRRGLLFAGAETGVFFSVDDGESWSRMRGGLPEVPVYDLKIKGSDLVAGTHGRSFWILDDISPLRILADGNLVNRLIPPRTAIRTRLRSQVMHSSKNIYFTVDPIDGGIAVVEKQDGTKNYEHLDIGENPPHGAIVYYWLADGEKGPVALIFRDAEGHVIATLRSNDSSLHGDSRPSAKPGLNRYVWDMRYPGPAELDASLLDRRNKPLVPDLDPQQAQSRCPAIIMSSSRSDPRLSPRSSGSLRIHDSRPRLTPISSNLPCYQT